MQLINKIFISNEFIRLSSRKNKKNLKEIKKKTKFDFCSRYPSRNQLCSRISSDRIPSTPDGFPFKPDGFPSITDRFNIVADGYQPQNWGVSCGSNKLILGPRKKGPFSSRFHQVNISISFSSYHLTVFFLDSRIDEVFELKGAVWICLP